jgi:hypothetical protein
MQNELKLCYIIWNNLKNLTNYTIQLNNNEYKQYLELYYYQENIILFY